MTDKKKRLAIIGVCGILCAALAVGIATRFGGNAELSSGKVEDGSAVSSDPNVSIQGSDAAIPDPKPNMETQAPAQNDPAQGADSNGTEQTIQADPVKPAAPEKPDAPDGKPAVPDAHKAEDIPEEERKTEDEAPPAYEEKPTAPPVSSEPAAGSTNSAGQVYVPGFGYVDHGGENTVIEGNDIYENGNKIGIMGGE